MSKPEEEAEKILAQQKEIEALLGVIDGMRIIIKNLEDGNRKEQREV